MGYRGGDLITEEMVAHAFGRITGDEGLLQRFVRDDRSLARKVLDALKDFIDKVRAAIERGEKAKLPDREMESFYSLRDQAEEMARLFSEAIESTRGQTEREGQGGNERYSISRSLSEQLDRVLDGTFDSEASEVQIGTTSDFLESLLGLKIRTVTMPASSAYSSMVSKNQATKDGRYNKNTNYHNLGKNGLIEALRQSDEAPVFAYAENAGSGDIRIALVTESKDYKKYNVVVYEAIGTKGLSEGKLVDVDKVLSAYGREKIIKDVENALEDKTLLYYDKEKGQRILDVPEGLSLNSKLENADLDNNIKRFKEIVKQKSNQDSSDVKRKYSLKKDREYMAAVEAGDMETAQRMVDEAAREAGYTTPKLYHGTKAFGFTVFDTSRTDDGISLFATSSRQVAETYSGKTPMDRITGVENIDGLHGAELLSEARKYTDRYNNYALVSDEEKGWMRSEAQADIANAAERAEEYIRDKSEELDTKIIANFKKIISALYTLRDSETEDECSDAVYDCDMSFKYYAKREELDERVRFLKTTGISESFGRSAPMLEIATYEGDVYAGRETNGMDYVYDDDLKEDLKLELRKGIYGLYGDPGRHLTIDADGGNWNRIAPTLELQEYGIHEPQSTRGIASAAKAMGYDSVLIRNLHDSGGKAEYSGISDVYIFFNPKSLKSADPVTYDDEGNVILLSERFNTENPDIRYSLKKVSGEKGEYGKGVLLDTDIFDGVKPRNWGARLRSFVYSMAGSELTMYDKEGRPETVYLARENDRVQKDGAKNSHKVIDKLARYNGDNVRALATVHLSEALLTSGNESRSSDKNHKWLDENGWIYRTVYLEDRSGNIYEAILNIADGRDSRTIYDISNIRIIDKSTTGGVVPSAVSGGARSTSRSAYDEKIPQGGSDVKHKFSLAGQGNGYYGYSMSNNAVDAYENGEKPKSKWTKADLIEAVREINPDIVDALKTISAATLRDRLLYNTSWHHTSSYYNRTKFYSIDEDAVRNLTADDVISWSAETGEKKERPATMYRGDFEYIEWSGTRKHPKAKNVSLKDVNIEERGSFYIVTDDSGNVLARKKIGSNGTYATDYAENQRIENEKAEREATIRDNSSAEALAFYDELQTKGKESSNSGALYAIGRKPLPYQYDIGLEHFFDKGEKRLRPNKDGGYDLEVWNGTEWEPAEDGEREIGRDTKYSLKKPKAVKDFENNFSGTVDTGEYAEYIDSGERGIISHGIKKGYAEFDRDAKEGAIYSARFRYAFITDRDKVILTDMIPAGNANIHEEEIEDERIAERERIYGRGQGQNTRVGEEDTRSRSYEGRGSERFAESEEGGQDAETDRLDRSKQPGRTGDNRQIEGASQREVRHSLQGSRGALSDAARLAKENEALRERVDYWKGQTRITKERTVREKDVNKLAKEITGAYVGEGEIDEADIQKRMKALGDYIVQNDNLTYEDLKEQACDIARDIAQAAVDVLDDGRADEFAEIKNYFRGKKIFFENKGDISEYQSFRKRNFGRFILTSDMNNPSVDQVYKEMSEMFPAYFPDDITNSADQLIHISEVLDDMQPIYYNPYSTDMYAVVEHIGGEIIDGLLSENVRQMAPTFADKQAKKFEKQRALYQAKIKEIKEQRDKKYEALKEHYREQREKRIKAASESKERAKLLKLMRRLKKIKTSNANRELINSLIGELDDVAKSITNKKLGELRELEDWYLERKENDPDFIPDPNVEKALQRLHKKRITDMTIDDVRTLTMVLSAFEVQIRTEQKLIQSKYKKDIFIAGQETIQSVENSAGHKKSFSDSLVSMLLSPVRLARRIAGYDDNSPLVIAMRELQDGERKAHDYEGRAGRITETFAGKKEFVKNTSGKKAEKIVITGRTLDGDVKVAITPAMRISLYLHSLNSDNMRHIAEGGIVIPDWSLYLKGDYVEAYKRGTRITLSPSEIAEISKGMSALEKQYANAIRGYFNGMSRDEINAVSLELNGYELAEIENYFPINVDPNFLGASFDSVKYDGSIEGMGWTNERVHSSKPVMLYDADKMFEKYVRQHAKYVGLAIPVRNMNKILGTNARSFDENGKFTGYQNSVMETIGRKWGTNATDYLEALMSQIQNGQRRSDSKIGRLLGKGRGNYAKAVLTLNASVAIKQAAKVRHALRHPGMTIDVIKKVPEILDKPIMVMKSLTVSDRLTMFGEVFDENGTPVLVVLEINKNAGNDKVLDVNVVNNAYGKDRDIAGFIKTSEILYIDPNRKRTEVWLHGRGLQLPLDITKLGSIGKITYSNGEVNISGKKILFEDLDETQASIAGNDEWDTTRIRDGKAEKTMRLSDIVAMIEHDFGINVTTGHIRKRSRSGKVMGEFSRKDKGIRTRVANDIVTRLRVV